MKGYYSPGYLEAMRRVTPEQMNDILNKLYAVRGDVSREHTLIFHGTTDEFAFFKARLCEWARKRIL